MESTKYLNELHADHRKWIALLKFYSDEINSFNNRLSEIVGTNSKKEVLAHIEHFQNQFIRQKEVIDMIRHDVLLSEKDLQAKISINPLASDHQRMLDNQVLRGQIDTFTKIFDELKSEFKQFLSHVL
jgi:hypothetical protein